MTDYAMKVHGTMPAGAHYSWKWLITSNQSPSALVTTMAAGLTTMWTDGTFGMDAEYNAATTLDYFEIITLDGTFREIAKQSHTLSLPGTSGAAPQADNVTLVGKKVSSGIRRNQRGFTKLPGPIATAVVNAFYTNAVRDRFTAALRALLAAINADGSTLFTHTGATTTVGGVAPYTKTVYTDVTCSNKPGTFRPRTNKQIGVYT